MSLVGKSVLLTRRREQVSGLAERLERQGASVTVVPLIDIHPPESWDACDMALDRLGSYDAVLLTSPNAARFFFGRMRERRCAPSGTRVVAIGEATRAAAAATGDAGPGESFGSARELARHLLASPVDGKAYLFPCGDLALDELPESLREAGARVDRVVVYRTVAPPAEAVAPARELLARGRVDVVIFASPSAVRHFGELLGDLVPAGSAAPAVAVIGPTTGAEARRCGLDPRIIAEKPTAAAMTAAITKYFA